MAKEKIVYSIAKDKILGVCLAASLALTACSPSSDPSDEARGTASKDSRGSVSEDTIDSVSETTEDKIADAASATSITSWNTASDESCRNTALDDSRYPAVAKSSQFLTFRRRFCDARLFFLRKSTAVAKSSQFLTFQRRFCDDL